ncbi:beta-propeller domain-containing protein [Aliiglaciecola sp.]|nr:beta-propeller domain-containing protein [Aliiglaciecola sp.]
MQWKNMSYVCLATTSIFVVSACGSSSEEEPLVLPQVNQAKGFEGPLAQGDAATFIRNGIYATTLNGVPVSASADNTSSPAVPEGFSQTNTIEQGVDEVDRVKYDGNTLFLATYPVWSESGSSDPQVRVLTRNEDFSLSEQSPISYDIDDINIQGLYLNNTRLAVVGSAYPVYAIDALTMVPWYYDSANLTIDIYDVSNPADIAQTTNIKIDGALLSTRLIENQLYVVSSYVPYIENLNPAASTEEQKLDNYRNIINTPSSDIMPKMYTDGQAAAMNDVSQCYVPGEATNNDGHAQILTVTRIDLTQPTDTQSMCMSVYAFMMYMSQNSLYLGSATQTDKTAFHKVDLANLDYQASGSVDGFISWQSDPLFKVDEEQDYFRVVTTDYAGQSPVHKLHILQQQGTELTAVATLPNDSQPEAIGKPDEEIYAVRFIEDKAYIVTFEQIDPLYVINLTDNTQPYIQGSLEIPGFSRYLHPLENDLLLGVGQQVDFQDIPDTGSIVVEPVTTSGMKISLFDVRDPANPQELTSIVEPDAYTPVEFNYKALTWLERDGVYQFAFPTERWLEADGPNGTSYWKTQSNLMLLETNSNSDVPSLNEIGSIQIDSESREYIYVGDDRSIIHGDKIYYIHGNKVWLSDWQTPQVTSGPY